MLILKYHSKLESIAYYYVKEEAPDIVQEIWLKLCKKQEYLDGIINIEAWLFQVTKHFCLTHIRKQASIEKQYKSVSFEENLEFFESFILEDDITENAVLAKEASNVFLNQISRLKDIYSLPMMLYYYSNFSLTEISQYLELPVSTIKWRLYTGRQALKKELIKGGYFNDQKASRKSIK